MALPLYYAQKWDKSSVGICKTRNSGPVWRPTTTLQIFLECTFVRLLIFKCLYSIIEVDREKEVMGPSCNDVAIGWLEASQLENFHNLIIRVFLMQKYIFIKRIT